MWCSSASSQGRTAIVACSSAGISVWTYMKLYFSTALALSSNKVFNLKREHRCDSFPALLLSPMPTSLSWRRVSMMKVNMSFDCFLWEEQKLRRKRRRETCSNLIRATFPLTCTVGRSVFVWHFDLNRWSEQVKERWQKEAVGCFFVFALLRCGTDWISVINYKISSLKLPDDFYYLVHWVSAQIIFMNIQIFSITLEMCTVYFMLLFTTQQRELFNINFLNINHTINFWIMNY